MKNSKTALEKIIISLLVLLILFNHSGNILQFAHISQAEEIEIEELNDNEEENSEIEVEAIDQIIEQNNNILINSTMNEVYKNSILYENESIEDNHSTIEIDDSSTLEDVEIEVASKINKKISFDAGLYIEEFIKVTIKRNDAFINNAIISFEDIDSNDFKPIHAEIVGKNNISSDGAIKILEEDLDNSGDTINLEYKMILVYPKEVENIEESILKGSIVLENNDENVKKEFDSKDNNNDEVEKIDVPMEFTTSDNPIYKSYLRASAVSSEKYDTEYYQKIKINLLNNDLNAWYDIDTGFDEFETDESNIILDGEVKYIKTEILKSKYDEAIGINGFIEIYNNDEIIGVIDSTTKVVDEKYVFEYKQDYDRLVFKIIGANKGTIEIENTKAIIGTDRYSNNILNKITGIKSTVVERINKFVDKQDVRIKKQIKEMVIPFEETYTKATLDIDNTIFSTNLDNEVTFDITLDTSEEKYEIFSNPSFEILLPSMINHVDIESINLLNKNGLSLDSWEVYDNQNGNKVIKITLEGNQATYSPKMSLPGTHVILETKLKVSDLTPTGTTSVRMTYTNGISDRAAYSIEGKDSYSCEASYYSNVGILSLTQLEGYNKANEKIYHIGKDAAIGRLDTSGSEKTASLDITLVNNYNKDINNVIIIGRIPAVGMVDSDLDSLNATFNTTLKGSISTAGLLSKVYYSTKTDCEINDDSWVESPENYATIKSFKVVIDGGLMSHGEMEKISYQLVIPEDLGPNQKVYSLYTTYYEYENQNCKEESSIALETDTATITLGDCQNNYEVETDKKALKIGTRATAAGFDLIEGNDIYNGQMIRYTYVISNDSNETITNIKLIGSVHNGNMYYREVYDNTSSTDGESSQIYRDLEDKDGTHKTSELTIESLNPGESKVFTYQVFARNNQADGSRDVYGTLKVTADGIEEEEIKTVSNNIVDSDIELEVLPATSEPVDMTELPTCNAYDFYIRVRNNTKETIDNVVVKVDMSKLLTLNEFKSIAVSELLSGYEEGESKNTAQFTIDHIPAEQDYYLTLATYIGEIDLYEKNGEFSVLARTNYNDKTYYSNDYNREVFQTITSYSSIIKSNPPTESVVSNGDKVEYNVELTNIGLVFGRIEIGTPIPEGLKLDWWEAIYPDGSRVVYDSSVDEMPQSTSDTYDLEAGEKVIFNIKCTVSQVEFVTEADRIIFTTESDLTESNTIVYYINPDDIIHEGWNKDAIPDNEEEAEINPEEVIENPIEEPVEEIETPTEEEPKEIIEDTGEYVDENPNYDEHNDDEEIIENEPDDLEVIDEDTDKNDFIKSTEEPKTRNNIATQTSYVKTNSKYSLGGKVWLDSNRDGIASNESNISDINVYLYKLEIKDSTLVNSTKTDSDGNYVFSDVEEGNYYIVFDYDNNEYSITKYNASASINSITSMCSKKALDVNGNTKFYALSEKISLNSDVNNINLGLTPKSVFDFSIKSTIEQVYIKYSDEYKEYSFGEEDSLPKVEINRKKAENSVVTMKICVEVENIGNISGYIIQLKEVLPDGFQLDEKQNMNWTAGKDNSFYYSGLAKERIEPSETKRIYLIVYKNIGDSSLGTFNNEVSIEETSNDELVEETNIENNNSSQSFILSISTGAATYVLLACLLILVLAFIVIMISNKVMPNFKYKKITIRIIILGFILISILLLLINTYADGGDGYSGNNLMKIVREDSYSTYSSNISKFKIYPVSGKRYKTGGDSSGQLKERRLQCCEGLDVVGSISASFNTNHDGRGIASVMRFNSTEDTYTTLAINNKTYSGTSRDAEDKLSFYASRLAYIGYSAEANWPSGPEVMKKKHAIQDLLYNANGNHKVTGNNVLTQMLGYSYSISFANTYGSSSQTGVYYRLSAKLKDFKKKCYNSDHSNTVVKVRSGDTTVKFDANNRIGPFWVKCPVSTQSGYVQNYDGTDYDVGKNQIDSRIVIEYYDKVSNNWKPVKCNIYYGNSVYGSTNNNGVISASCDISGKEIYIEPTATLPYERISRFSITDYRNEFESKGISFFMTTNYIDTSTFQDLICMRGSRNSYSTWVEWNFIAYKVDVNKYLYSNHVTNNSVITESANTYTRSGMSESDKISKPVAVDANDTLIYRVDITNHGTSVDKIVFKDEYDSGLEFVNFSTKGDGSILNTNTKWSRSGSTYTYNNTVATGNTVSVYLLFRPKSTQITNSNPTMDNTATLTHVYIGSNDIISKLVNTSKKTSTERIKLNTYYFDVDKKVVKINTTNNDSTGVSADPGDTVIMKVTVKNNSTANKSFGNLYGITLTDESTFTSGYTLSDYVDLEGFSPTVGGTYSKTCNSDGIQSISVNATNYTIKLTSSLNVGNTKDFFVKYKVKKTIKDTNLVLTNTAKITAMKNRSGVDLYNLRDKINKGDLNASATIRIRKYNISFSKTIQEIKSSNENNLPVTEEICQTHDYITFRISFKNTGTKASDNGVIKTAVIEDVIDTNAFQYDSYTSSDSAHFKYDNTTHKITYSNDSGLALNTEVYVDIKVKVIYTSTTTANLKNTATIKEIRNINNVIIYNASNDMVKSNKFTDSKTLRYQTYHFALNKYISYINSTQVTGRHSLNNTQRNDSPVEVVKGDVVTYSIDFKNNTTGNNNDKTKLYKMIFKDTVQDGLQIKTNTITVKCGQNNVSCTPTLNGNVLTLKIDESFVLDVNKTLNITIQAEVVKSNFYLPNIENKFEIASVKNRNNTTINSILVGDATTNNKDYIRLKNLEISGNVWEDKNRNGEIDSSESGMSEIEVRLVDITNKKYISTTTDGNGNYHFGTANAKGYKISNYSMNNGAITYTTTNTQDDKFMCDAEGRVIKATKRDDTTGNYNNQSAYINYVIEYIYDGIHYYTTTYRGRENITDSDLSINDDYKKDSNAHESNYYRDKMYDSLDIIYYNKALGKDGTETDLTYVKDGHKSTLDTSNYYLSAFSFGDGNSITPLWLKKSDGTVLGESEYLKYINLGLIYKSADLDIENDVDSITTYINGEETTYEYNQGNEAGSEYAGAYRTGGTSSSKYYKLKIYASDYYYQSTDYKNEVIAQYKENTELEIQVKYKVTINNKTSNNNQTYARIREITDYYPRKFNTDLFDKTTVRIYNPDGDLVDTQLANLTVADSSNNNYVYSKTIKYADKSGDDINKVYIQPPTDKTIDIPEGGKAEFYLTFIVGKAQAELSTGEFVDLLKIDNSIMSNIVEINAYSLYKNGSENTFGLIDEDSNPGNHEIGESSLLYEDDTYEARLKITKRTTTTPDDTSNGNKEDTERTITGFVWEDVRSETVGGSSEIQYVGDGKYDRSKNEIAEAMSLNTSNVKDKKIAGVTAHLVEEIRIKQPDGSYKLYEYDWGNSASQAYKDFAEIDNQRLKSTSSENTGEYNLHSMIPGIYKVRFYYGEENESGVFGTQELKYNGQDFKSTRYTGVSQETEKINDIFGYETGINTSLKEMINSNENDAVDDELRRLETMAYAEVQRNSNQVVLNQTKYRNASAQNKEDAQNEFIDNTSMYADTAFMKINVELTKSGNDYELNRKSFDFNLINTKLLKPTEYNYEINNIDFGLEYRPKTAVTLNQYIKEYKVILENKTVLADVKFDEIHDTVNQSLIGTIVNKSESTGLENVAITEGVSDSINPIVLTVDESIIQGASIIVTYVHTAKNEGEVDRININLDNLRESFESELNSSGKSELTISEVAYNKLKEYYDISIEKYNDTLTDKKTNVSIMALGNNINNLKYKSFYNATTDDGYYGKYLGTTYYTGIINNDIIAKTKISAIVDYVPNSLDFNQEENIGENHYWSPISIYELKENYIDNSILQVKGNSPENLYDQWNSKERTYYDYASGKSNIALSIDESRYVLKDADHNKSLSRLLTPMSTGSGTVDTPGTTNNSGQIYLTASITLSNSDQLDDLFFTNTSEIVEIVSQTGRCTPTDRDRIENGTKPKTTPINVPNNIGNDETIELEPSRELIATIGNHNPKQLYTTTEADTSTADPIVLIPPFGKIPFYLKYNKKPIIIISASVIAIVAMIIIGNKKKLAIKKFLRKKKISLKKYYK